MFFENDTELPDPDQLCEEVKFETAYRAVRDAMKSVVLATDSPISLVQLLGESKKVLLKEGHDDDIVQQALQSKAVLEAIKVLMRDEVIKKMDNETFCRADKVPKYRSLDDIFSTYHPPRPPKTGDELPTKKEIAADVARAIPMLGEWFSMGELAEAWGKFAPKRSRSNLCAIFGMDKGKGKLAFMKVLQMLVDQGVVAPHPYNDDCYHAVPKKPERYRCLDDEWE